MSSDPSTTAEAAMDQIAATLAKTMPPELRRLKQSRGCTDVPSADELAEFGRKEALALADERRRNAQADLEQAVGRAGIPRRFLNRTFSSYQADSDAQRNALEVCQVYAQEFQAVRDAGNCLILSGAPGTGKTHLACAILSVVIRAGHTGLFLTISEALRLIRDTYSPRTQCTESQAFAALTEPDLLVLDEVGVAIGDAGKRQALLFDVLNARYADQRPTILIGNLTEAEMEAYLGPRVMDRVMETGSALVPFTWLSYRRGGTVGVRNRSSYREGAA